MTLEELETIVVAQGTRLTALENECAMLRDENAALKASVAADRLDVMPGGLCVRDETIPDPILRAVFGHDLDHVKRGGYSSGYHAWGGRPKARLRGGFLTTESNDTIDAGFYGGHYDLTKIGPDSILPPYELYSSMAFIYAARLTGYPPKPEGRSCEIALKHGAIDIRLPKQPGHSDPDFNLCRTVVTFGPPQEFSGAWKGWGIGMWVGFWTPRAKPDGSPGFDVKMTPVCISRPTEVPYDAFVMWVRRPG